MLVNSSKKPFIKTLWIFKFSYFTSFDKLFKRNVSDFKRILPLNKHSIQFAALFD
jgi:hypothetical protein